MIIKIKAIGADKTWLGQFVAQDSYFTIPNMRVMTWAANELVQADLLAGTAIINDGTIDIPDFANQMRYMNSFFGPVGILSGTEDPLATAVYGKTGWFYFRYGAGGGTIFKKNDDGINTNWTAIT